eukprot:2507074-Rhodomonas_salina.1
MSAPAAKRWHPPGHTPSSPAARFPGAARGRWERSSRAHAQRRWSRSTCSLKAEPVPELERFAGLEPDQLRQTG